MSGEESIEELREQKRERLRERLQDDESVPEEAEPGGTDAPGEPVAVEGTDHLAALVGDHDVVLTDFYADWCGPCQAMEPAVEAVAAETPAAVAKVDVDANQALAGEYGVRGVPTLVLFADGEPVERLVGAQSEADLRALVGQAT